MLWWVGTACRFSLGLTATEGMFMASTDQQDRWQQECQLQRDLAELQVYHLFDRLRAGEVPAECNPAPPPGRTVFEFATAAWTTFYSYYFRDADAGDHREPAWLAFTERLRNVFDGGSNLDAAVERGCRLLEPHVAERDARMRDTFGAVSPFGCFRYDYSDESRYVAMHFANAYEPQSPFDHMDRLVASLADIIEDIAANGYTVDRIGCDSWLDNVPAFQSCFPPSFAASMVPTNPDTKNGYGWWGQFIDRTGSLHEGRARQLKRTRRFRYPRMHAECPYTDFVEHVNRANAGAS